MYKKSKHYSSAQDSLAKNKYKAQEKEEPTEEANREMDCIANEEQRYN